MLCTCRWSQPYTKQDPLASLVVGSLGQTECSGHRCRRALNAIVTLPKPLLSVSKPVVLCLRKPDQGRWSCEQSEARCHDDYDRH